MGINQGFHSLVSHNSFHKHLSLILDFWLFHLCLESTYDLYHANLHLMVWLFFFFILPLHFWIMAASLTFFGHFLALWGPSQNDHLRGGFLPPSLGSFGALEFHLPFLNFCSLLEWWSSLTIAIVNRTINLGRLGGPARSPPKPTTWQGGAGRQNVNPTRPVLGCGLGRPARQKY